eukprot:97862-Alexandrium_andersonii.AAC.1
MSASLVGSEMCIRDSHPIFNISCASIRSQLRSPRRSTRDVARAVPGTEPVSYTHLTLPTICSV